MNPNPSLRPPVKVRPSRLPVPPGHRREVAYILISSAAIERRVAALAAAISRDYQDRHVVLVALLNGTVTFLADLMRRLEFPLDMDLIGVSSYRGGTESGDLVYTKKLKLDVKGRHVLVVDDILDTGKTLRAVTTELAKSHPASLKTCVLLDKPEGREGKWEADYVGFVTPKLFVVGYGLDYNERFRNLPYIGVLRPEVYGGKPGSEPCA